MKKRMIALVLVISMAMGTALTGCGSSSGSTTTTDSSETEESTDAATDDGEASADNGNTLGTPEDPVTLSFGAIASDPWTSTSQFESMANEAITFFEQVEGLSDGGVTLEGYWSSTLGGNPSMEEQVMMGELDMHFGQPMSSNDARYGCWNLPFIYDNYEQIIAAVNPVDGPVFELSSEWCEENGVHLVLISMAMMRSFINSKHEVRVPSDVSDLKIRTYEDEVVNTFWSGLGTASIIAGSEIYSALQTKTVDAMEFHLTGITSYNLNEVASYVTDLNWQWTNGGCITMNKDVWDSLSTSAQEAITEAALIAFNQQAAEELSDLASIEEYLTEELGMEFTTLTEEEHEEWVAYARTLDDTFREMVGEDAFDAYMAAVDEAKERVENGTAYVVE